MKRVFIVGDWRTGTGPANVTKQYIKHFPKGTRYQIFTSKVMRLPELYIKISLSDVILFSGYSYQNVLGMRFAKKLGRKTAYIIHGAITHENSINHAEDSHMSEVEEETLKLADKLYGVSKRFSEWMKKEYPQYADKISYAINGVDEGVGTGDGKATGTADGEADKITPGTRNRYDILSIGGGMPRKRILNICKAVELLNSNYNACYNKTGDNKTEEDAGQPYTLYVIGKEGFDTDAINQFDFVKNLGLVDAKTKQQLFEKCSLFIQNSCFETFGLAPVEALTNGMDVLTSSVCGVLDIFKNITDADVINDCENIEEIAEKIKYVTNHPNNARLLNDIDMNEMSWEARARQLYADL